MGSLKITVIAALAAIAVQACGGGSFTSANQGPTDDSGTEASAGTGGSAGDTGGTGGSSASGGSAGTGGQSGTGGQAGTAGTGGVAGESGSGGTAGIAGSGGEPDGGLDADATDAEDAAEEADVATDTADESDVQEDAADAPDAPTDVAEDEAAADAPHDAVAEEAAPPLCQNGQSEDCYSGPPATEDVGPCHGGTRECTNGAWGACQGQVLPKPEKCDWQDDDCNGVTDDVAPAQPVALTTAAGGKGATIAYASGALGIAWVRPESSKDQTWFGTANVSNGARLVGDKKLENATGAESHEAAITAAGQAWKIATLDTLPVAPHAALSDADQNGTVAKSSSSSPDGGDPANIAVTSGNGNALAVYDANGLLSRDVYYAFWNGTTLASHGVIAGGLSGQDSRHPAAIWTGSQYLVFWARDSGPKIVAKAISTTGSTTGNVIPTNGLDGFQPSPVWTPSGPAFTSRSTDYGTIRLTRLDQNVQSPQNLNVVSVAGASYQDANLGWNGTDFAVTWVEISGGSRRVKVARVKADGSMTSIAIPIADSGDPGTVRIAPTGETWSIVWDADGSGGRQLFWSSICR